MKLINKTKWDSKSLKQLCSIVIKKMGSHKKHQITVKTHRYRFSRDTAYGGSASLGGSWITMKVPLTEYKQHIRNLDGELEIKSFKVVFDCVDFARVLEHEIQHNLGMGHDVIDNCRKRDVSYIGDIKIEPRQDSIKPKSDTKKLRYDKIVKRLIFYNSKLNRIKNLIKKYESKKKYYDKILNIN